MKTTSITSFGKMMAEELTAEQIDSVSGGAGEETFDNGPLGVFTATCVIATFTTTLADGTVVTIPLSLD